MLESANAQFDVLRYPSNTLYNNAAKTVANQQGTPFSGTGSYIGVSSPFLPNGTKKLSFLQAAYLSCALTEGQSILTLRGLWALMLTDSPVANFAGADIEALGVTQYLQVGTLNFLSPLSLALAPDFPAIQAARGFLTFACFQPILNLAAGTLVTPASANGTIGLLGYDIDSTGGKTPFKIA